MHAQYTIIFLIYEYFKSKLSNCNPFQLRTDKNTEFRLILGGGGGGKGGEAGS